VKEGGGRKEEGWRTRSKKGTRYKNRRRRRRRRRR